MSKKEFILSHVLYFFGIVLLLFSLGMLIYQIVHVCTINWNSLSEIEFKETRSYIIIEFLTLAFKIVIAAYAMYCKKNLDDAINPLFTFTCLYLVFVILQTVLYLSNGGLGLGLIVSMNACIDIIVCVLFFGTTFFLKLDDWRSE